MKLYIRYEKRINSAYVCFHIWFGHFFDLDASSIQQSMRMQLMAGNKKWHISGKILSQYHFLR